MRPVFSLIGLLVVLGIAMLIFKMVEAPVIDASRRPKEQAQQLSGHDANGGRAADSVTLEARQDSGRLTSIDVTAIVAGGAMEQYYGLQAGDKIIEIVNVMPIRDVPFSDGDTAKALIAEAYQKQQQLIILRGSEQLTLPVSSVDPSAPQKEQRSLSPAERLLQNTKIPTH